MPDVGVAIIGTGFGGIGMAARLKRAGIGDLVLLERANDLGGTWRDNTGGCKSWYLDAEGRNVTLWPDFTWVYAWQTRRFDAPSYELLRELPTVTATRRIRRAARCAR
jgi:cation diffusion facilitator CzcD-associated flavoprotein CzcO